MGHFFYRGGGNSDLSDDAYEVGVAGPSWDDVDVEMAGDTGTGGSTLVDADVDALAVERFLAEFGGEFYELP